MDKSRQITLICDTINHREVSICQGQLLFLLVFFIMYLPLF